MRGYMVNNQILLYDKFIKNAINNDKKIKKILLFKISFLILIID